MSRTIEIELKGLAEIQRLFREFPQRTREEMTKAIRYSAALIQRHAIEESPIDTGQLRSSINIRFLQDAAVVSTGVKHALYVHEGTGIYGPRKQPLRPRTKKVLAWRSGGRWHFARSVKGMRANPFMERAAKRSTPGVQAAFDAAIKRVIG
jgi:hypothetical protein